MDWILLRKILEGFFVYSVIVGAITDYSMGVFTGRIIFVLAVGWDFRGIKVLRTGRAARVLSVVLVFIFSGLGIMLFSAVTKPYFKTEDSLTPWIMIVPVVTGVMASLYYRRVKEDILKRGAMDRIS